MIKNVRNLLILACLLLISMITYSAIKVPSEVTFDGEVYEQAYQKGDGINTNRITEYLRKGENLDTYVKLVAIMEFPETTDVKELAEYLIKVHKQKYPSLARNIIVKNDESEAQVDYMAAKGDITEFDIFRVLKKDDHVILYQYVYRNYSPLNTSDNTKWRNNLTQNKSKWIELMMQVNYIK